MIGKTDIPFFKKNIYIDEEDGHPYLYNSILSSFVVLDNDVSNNIVRLIDGKRNIKKIALTLSKQFDFPLDKICVDVCDMIEVLQKKDFLQIKNT